MQHPEVRPGEIFLSNIAESDLSLLESWKTKRLGTKAYDGAGEVLTDEYVPVFVSLEEYRTRYGPHTMYE